MCVWITLMRYFMAAQAAALLGTPGSGECMGVIMFWNDCNSCIVYLVYIII